MIDGQIDRIQEINRTRCRQRSECVHFVRDMAKVDQSVGLRRELIGSDQAGCCLSDARITLKTHGTYCLIRRDE